MATETVSALVFLNKIISWDGKSQDIIEALTTAFEAKDYLDCITNLKARGVEPLLYINILDKVCPLSTPTRCIRFTSIRK